MSIKVIADQNMLGIEQLLPGYFDVEYRDARHLRHAELAGVQALLVRSVTLISEKLISGTDVSFVGSATIGTDHVDLAALERLGVSFVNAPGCNALAVADYVLACFLLSDCINIERKELVIGLVGFGNVGKAVAKRFISLGYSVCFYDPEAHITGDGDGDGDWQQQIQSGRLSQAGSYDQLAACCTLVSFHVPAIEDGEHATINYGGDAFWQALSGKPLINTCRGQVLSEQRLLAHKANGGTLFLDVWPQEPFVSEELAQCCTVASPHIAGYSTLGKLRGSFVVANALLAHFGQPPHIARLEALQRAMGLPACDIAWPALANTEQWQESLASILAELAGLEALTARFKRSALGDAAQFDAMRKTYNTRFELAECDTTHVSSWPKGLIAQLAALVDA